MKLVKIILLAVAAALLTVSCVQKSGPEGTLGNYSVTNDKGTVNASTGSGIIYTKMYDAVAKLKFDFRTTANDKAVIAATDKVASDYKDYANETIKISVVFTEANALGEAQKAPVVIKTYTFTPVS